MKKSKGSTKSERYLASLCSRSFLNLWSYPNPFRDQGKRAASADGKELCDLLVICGDDVIIFSDKSCEYGDTGRPEIDWRRWYKRAIVKSAHQVRGAERWIREFPDRIFLDHACNARIPVALPPPSTMRMHRIVVAIGAKAACQRDLGGAGSLMIIPRVPDGISGNMDGLMPFAVGALGKQDGYIHHLDDVTLDILLSELDTITDFVQYLEKKEALVCSGRLGIAAGEEDLLARYLTKMEDSDRHGFAIPPVLDAVMIEEGLWQKYQASLDYIRKKEADRPSYQWDRIIEETSQHALDGTLIEGPETPVYETERILRIMAREPRLMRRMLASSLLDLQSIATPGNIPTRRVCTSEDSELVYAFILVPEGDGTARERSFRRSWVENYCFVLAWKNRNHKTIIGIATENDKQSDSRSYDFCLVQVHHWTDKMKQDAKHLQETMGIFQENKIKITPMHAKEYPSEADAGKRMFGLFGDTTADRGMRKAGRNAPCPCGSGRKYKKCCGG